MSSPVNFNNTDDQFQGPETPRTPKAARHSRSRHAELLKAPRKPKVSFKDLNLDSPPSVPSALSPSTTDNVATNLPTVRTNSREFRRSVSPVPDDKKQAVAKLPVVRERQLAHWVKFHNVSLGRARTAKMRDQVDDEE